jgi:hypothetical protein
MFPFMYSDYTNTVDSHTIITISIIYCLYLMFCHKDGFVFSVLDSRC